MHVTGWELLLVASVIAAGACLQGSIGFGMGVVSLPFMVMIEPALVPQTVLLGAMPLVVLMAIRSRTTVVAADVALIVLGRIPGSIVAVVVLGVLSQSTLAVAASCVVLAAVVVSLRVVSIVRTSQSLVAAGFLAGLFGTSTGIGGPPIALLYQNETGDEVRSTLGTVNLISITMSLVFLIVGGAFDLTDTRTGLALMPASICGFALSKYVIPYADRRLRVLVLAVCSVAALAAVAKVLFAT